MMTEMAKEEDNQTPLSEKFTYEHRKLNIFIALNASRHQMLRSPINTPLVISLLKLIASDMTQTTNILPPVSLEMFDCLRL